MSARFILFFLFSFSRCAIAGQHDIDSLVALIKHEADDTNKVNHLNGLLREYVTENEYDKGIACGEEALQLAQELSFKKGLSATHNGLGNLYREQGNFPKALGHFLNSLQISEQMNDEGGIAVSSGNIGTIYKNEKDYTRALQYFEKALSTFEKMNDRPRVAVVLNNLGILYWTRSEDTLNLQARQAFLDHALEYYSRALKIDEELKNKNGMAIRLGNIATIYKGLSEITNDPAWRDSLRQRALDYYSHALSVNKERERKNYVATWLGNIGSIYAVQGKYKEGEALLLRAIGMADSLGLLTNKMDFYGNLSELYNMKSDYKKSLEYYRRYSAAKDSVFNESKKKELMRHEMDYEFEKKEAALRSEQEKKEAMAEAESKRQRLFLVLVGTIAIAITVIAFIIFRALRLTRGQKNIIEHQKQVVEEKQKEILDSIHYAKRIQQSLLPSEKYLERSLKRLKDKL